MHDSPNQIKRSIDAILETIDQKVPEMTNGTPDPQEEQDEADALYPPASPEQQAFTAESSPRRIDVHVYYDAVVEADTLIDVTQVPVPVEHGDAVRGHPCTGGAGEIARRWGPAPEAATSREQS